MGLPFDLTTLALLLSPLLLPRIYGLVGQGLSRLGQKQAPRSFGPSGSHSTSRQGGQANGVFASRGRSWRDGVAAALAVYSILHVGYLRPFSFFATLGALPLTAPASQLQTALAWHNLSDAYAEDLAMITSLDHRILYAHFGHAAFKGCHMLLGSTLPKDLLLYAGVRLLRTYMIPSITLAFANPRWKVSLCMTCLAGLVYEMYMLVTTELRLPSDRQSTFVLSDFLSFYRNIGFLALSISAVLLPRKVPPMPLSSSETVLLQGLHALMQRQDLLQTRIKAVEAARASSAQIVAAQDASAQLSGAQKNGLKAFLRSILGQTAVANAAVPSIKIESSDSTANSGGHPVNAMPITTAANSSFPQALPKSESLDLGDLSFATARAGDVSDVIVKEEELSSPSLSRSSSSSHIDTPTPAMRRPVSLDLSTAAADLKSRLPEEDETLDFDRPMSKRASLDGRLTKSLGPSGPVKHPNILPDIQQHKRSATYDAMWMAPQQEVGEAVVLVQDPAICMPNGDAHAALSPPDASPSPRSEDQQASSSAYEQNTPDVPNIMEALDETVIPLPKSAEQKPIQSTSTPAVYHIQEEDGWTQVVSKKSKLHSR